MNPVVDIRFVYLLGALLGILLIGLMGFVHLRLATYGGFRLWLASIACYAMGLTLLWANSVQGSPLAVFLGNLFFLGNAGLALLGTSRFLGRRIGGWITWGPLAAGLAAAFIFSWVDNDRTVRVLVLSASLALIQTTHLGLIRYARLEPTIGRTASCLTFFLGAYIAWTAVRMAFILVLEERSSPSANALFQAATYAVVCACNIGFVFSYLGLTFARTEARQLHLVQSLSELKRAIDEHAIAAVTDREGRIMEVNRRFCEISKYSQAELVGQNHRLLNSGTHPREFFKGLWAEILAGRPWHGEICNRAKDGALYWVSSTIVPIQALDGRTERFISIMADITARKKAEAALRESETRYRVLVERSPESVTVHRDGTIIYANPASAGMFGAASAQDLVGRRLFDLIHPDFHAQALARRKNISERGIGGPLAEMRYVALDGRIFDVETQSAPILFDGIPATQITAHDISGLKRAAAERQEFERKLQETQKLESLGVLAGGIAHDFNNILTGILGNASLASLDLPEGSPVEDNLKSIREGAQRAAELCRQMLAYSGRGSFVVHNLSLSRLVEETAHLLKISISKKCSLRFDLSSGLPAIEADATQIRQVIMNLVINASEAIGEAGGVISLSTGLAQGEGGASRQETAVVGKEAPGCRYVFMEVSDSGCGMSPETQAKIFDPFFTTKFAGRGLGLAAVLGIVRGHKGVLKLASEQGRGTTFRLLFPCAGGEAETAAVAHEPKAQWKGKGCVLLVDDEESVRRTAAHMLGKMGFEVVSVADGLEAVEDFRADPDRFAMVIMDLTMPHINGNQALSELRAIRRDVRVVLMSGFNVQEAFPQLAGDERAGFLPKPFLYEDLSRVVQAALSGAPAAARAQV